jgi:hypothetical protein
MTKDEIRIVNFDVQSMSKADLTIIQLQVENAELKECLEKKSLAIQRIWKERDELRKANAELIEKCANVQTADAIRARGEK